MKKSFLLLSILCITLVACSKIDELTKFYMDFNETFTIPSSTVVELPINAATPEIESNSEATFSSNNTRKDLIESIKITQITLTLNAPADGDFSFLNAVELFIAADGLPDQRIAWKENIPNDIGKTLDLNTENIDIKEYIKRDIFTLKIKTTTDQIITSDQEIGVFSKFFVDARILGV